MLLWGDFIRKKIFAVRSQYANLCYLAGILNAFITTRCGIKSFIFKVRCDLEKSQKKNVGYPPIPLPPLGT